MTHTPTPGPWSYDGPHHSIIIWGAEPEQRVCFMTSDGPAEANADLIVHAVNSLPALVKALEDCRNAMWEDNPAAGWKEIIEAADAALASHKTGDGQ